MAEKKPETRSIYKITLKGNLKENTVSATFVPTLDVTKIKDVQTLLNVLTSGSHTAFVKLLGGLPILRPASEEEREAKIYVFVNDKDNNTYKVRKDLYDQLEAVFGNILSQLFPDVEYINSCNHYQQELAFSMDEAQAEEYKKEIEEITARVRGAEKEVSE